MKLKYSKKHPRVFSYKLKSGTLWGYRITYYDSFHKRRETQKRGFSTEMNAYRASLHDQTKIAENNSDLVKNNQITVKQYAMAFHKSRRKLLKTSTCMTCEGRFRKHIYPTIGNLKLNSINMTTYTEKVINTMVDNGYAKNTIRGVNRSFFAMMNRAVDDNIISKNPLKRIRIPNTKFIEKHIMTKKELKQFNDQLIKEPILTQVIFFTLEQTGIRRGELCGLKWEDIDIKNQTITIKRTRDCYGIREPKTPSSYRTISISKSLVDLYTEYKQKTQEAYKQQRKTFDGDVFLLQSKYWVPLDVSYVSNKLRGMLRKSGLDYLLGHFTAHYFRHMYASYLLNSGVPVTEISKALGHSSPAVTLKIYSEPTPGENSNLAEKFNGLW